MPFIGNQPAKVPLTSADITDNVITSAKIVDGTIALADLSATGTKSATTFLRGDNTFATPAGGVNTPAFFATATVDQSISDNVVTKVQFPSEIIDTNSCYDNATNYRFTPNVAGKYYIFSSVWLDSLSSNNFNSGSIRLYKNGSLFSWSYFQVEGDGRQYSQHVSIIDSANGSSDYYEIYAHCDTVSGTANVSNDTDKRNVFGAYKIIE